MSNVGVNAALRSAATATSTSADTFVARPFGAREGAVSFVVLALVGLLLGLLLITAGCAPS
jgi:hypothetical protein